MQTFWIVIYSIIAFMISIFLPFAIFLYETDEDKSIVKYFNISVQESAQL